MNQVHTLVTSMFFNTGTVGDLKKKLIHIKKY